MRVRAIPAAGLVLSLVLLDLVLIQPNHPDAVTWAALKLMPLELPVLLLGALALGRRAAPAAAVAAVALVLVALLKLADLGTHIAFGRGFDPVVDLNLVPAGARLVSGTIGVLPASLAALAVAVTLVLLGWLLLLGLRLWGRAGSGLPIWARGAAGIAACAFAVAVVAEVRTAQAGWRGWNPPGAAFTARVAVEEIRSFDQSRATMAEFAAAAASDPWRMRGGALDLLGGRDVTIVFVESYGRAAFDNPLYSARHRRTLAEGAQALDDAGLGIRSGWLTSPVKGGRSWLAHATLASGLDVSDQRRYGAMLASPRRTLYEIAAQAGYATAAVAPAIVLPWPEGPQFGFGQILAAADLGYAGQPFNWVTMPDQFTLSAFDRLVRQDGPLMSEIALISSHAPWTPVPDLVPWQAVGDGRVFDAMAAAGPTPREVWADRDRIREHYGLALDYAIRTVLSWAALPRSRSPLLVVLGDHQAAETVSQTGGHDVPVHLIGPPEVLALFEGWGWTDGPVPAPDLSPWPMSAFRDRFLAATSPPDEGGT